MNALGSRIAALIAAQGPMSIAQYMTVALHDPLFGYYATHDPLGKDFITAPEISQMFGELVGLWIVQCWIDQGKPSPARLVELGPGKGTLMADALRAAKLVPDFLAAIEVVLVEASATLRAVQNTTLAKAPARVSWRETFDDALHDKPLFLLANEFFDALPIRQYVKTDRGWCERMVTVNESGALSFALSPAPAPLTIPEARGVAGIGAVYEVCPPATAIAEDIAHTIAHRGGAALLVDYGYGAAGFGETFQALGESQAKHLLDQPGEIDLSAHVDFGALAGAGRAGGAAAFGPINQAELLLALGITRRAARLAQDPERGQTHTGHLGETPDIDLQLARLVDPDQMGTLFKALAILPANAKPPPGFA